MDAPQATTPGTGTFVGQLLSATAGLVGGAFIGAGLSSSGCGDPRAGCQYQAALFAMPISAGLFSALGVSLVGHLTTGNAVFVPTLVGGLLGGGVAALLWFVSPPLAILATVALPIAGPMIGYHRYFAQTAKAPATAAPAKTLRLAIVPWGSGAALLGVF